MSERCKDCPNAGGNRSLQDHRRLMGIIAAAYDQWPERRGLFQPLSSEHLRSWLICKAGPGWRKVSTFDITGFSDEQRAVMSSAVMGAHTHCGITGDVLYKIEPKSMKFANMNQAEFGKLRDAICEVIAAEIGVPAEQLLKEREKAAS